MNRIGWDPIWEEVFIQQEWGKYPGESLIRFIARNYYKLNRPDVKILEIGCGAGANIWYMSREGFDVYGIDGSETAIGKASQLLVDENLSAKLTVGDIIQLPYADGFFDAVVDVECICCNSINDSKKILSEVTRILKPSGQFYSRTFSEKMYVGKQNFRISALEYNNISDGPLAGKGFVRLMDNESIDILYGSQFKILSIDRSDITVSNGEVAISEWIIVSQKK